MTRREIIYLTLFLIIALLSHGISGYYYFEIANYEALQNGILIECLRFVSSLVLTVLGIGCSTFCAVLLFAGRRHTADIPT